MADHGSPLQKSSRSDSLTIKSVRPPNFKLDQTFVLRETLAAVVAVPWQAPNMDIPRDVRPDHAGFRAMRSCARVRGEAHSRIERLAEVCFRPRDAAPHQVCSRAHVDSRVISCGCLWRRPRRKAIDLDQGAERQTHLLLLSARTVELFRYFPSLLWSVSSGGTQHLKVLVRFGVLPFIPGMS